MVTYIQHIIWRFTKHKPDQYRLLDVQYNFMKNLILGDCNHLIKYILFGDEDPEEKKIKCANRHIPRSISWPGKEFIKDDDLDQFDKNKLNKEKIKLENDMELAIFRYKGIY